jgi:methylmalonyl-CoA mutase C-terminal domain/subunit
MLDKISDHRQEIKVLLSKIGLDGHTRGIKAVAAMLRDAGMEVVYLGHFQTPDGIVKSALEEDADVIGVSCLAGEHLTLVPKLVRVAKENKAEGVPIIVGGVVPDEDIGPLKTIGVAEVFTAGATSDQIISFIKNTVSQRRRT